MPDDDTHGAAARPASGLDPAEAAARLQRDGPNELNTAHPRTPWLIVLEVAREPMLQLLVGAGLLYVLLGDTGEALMLLAFVGVTVAITLVQEQRTEHALQALRELASPRALVLRGGERRRIAGREVVIGDLLVLTEGDRIAADARLLSASDLRADESLLTGEALPVPKHAPDRPMDELDALGTPVRPGAGVSDRVYAGTLVVGGQGLARVTDVGLRSEIGRIGSALGQLTPPTTPLTLQTRRLVRIFSVIGLALSLVVVLLYGATRGDWTAALLAGITLAMSMLPEEFLLILSVFMAMGAWRMSRQRVLVRRSATLEALGAATVLCTDKTGTLTENRMAIAELVLPGGQLLRPGGAGTTAPAAAPAPAAAALLLPEPFQELVEIGRLASEPEPFDPMDLAFVALAGHGLAAPRAIGQRVLEHGYGLAPDLPVMTHVWRSPGASRRLVAVKGAHEAVAGLCGLGGAPLQAANDAAQAMAARGLRVLAVARADFEGSAWPATPGGFAFTWLGLVGLADPLRAAVPAALQECHQAGIRVIMITGDHPVTACAIAAQAGLMPAGPGPAGSQPAGLLPAGPPGAAELQAAVLTGADLEVLDDAALRRRMATLAVCARVLPEQKLRIVQALQAQGAVVAMTGDGVNDAPSLRAAHIGIAMGGRGTDVAREAASLVLLDDDFGAIVQAVRLGRRINDNLRKAMAYAMAVHVPIAGLALLPLLTGLPLLFAPVHIAFLELVINPVCAFVFESETEEDQVMRRPPRAARAPLFSRRLVLVSLLQGLLVLAAVAALYVTLLRVELVQRVLPQIDLGQLDVSEGQARACAFTALVLASVALIIANRSDGASLRVALRRPNPTLWRVVGGTLLMLGVVLTVPVLQQVFRFEALSPALAGIAVALAGAVLVLLEAMKPTLKPHAAPT